MDTNSGQKVEIMVDGATGVKFRACRTCKRFNVPLLGTRRSCSGCRQKQNESSRKSREKTQAKIREAELGTGSSGQRPSSPSIPTSAHAIPPPPKRKAEQATQSLEGGARKKKVAKITKSHAKTRKESTTEQPPRYPEYQSASLLYEAAKEASSAGGQFNFLGCHSIVRCEDINHRKRAKSVTRALRKVVKLPFKYDVPCSDVDTEIKCLLKYSCDCSNPQVASGSSESSTKKDDEITGNVNPPCGGLVMITVQDDNSHALGIPGQQIVVKIQH